MCGPAESPVRGALKTRGQLGTRIAVGALDLVLSKALGSLQARAAQPRAIQADARQGCTVKAGADQASARSAAIIAEKRVSVKKGFGKAYVCTNLADVL